MGKLLATLCLLLIGMFDAAVHGANNANFDENSANDLQLPTFSLLQRTEVIRFEDLPDPFVLKSWPLISESERITIDSKPLTRNLDYRIDYRTGAITFLKNYPPESTIQISYQALPFAIKKQYKRDLFQQMQPSIGPSAGEGELEPQADFSRRQPTETELPPLRVTGTQTFGVSVGSGRSLSQDQALRISVDGKVSENVNVIALLSDQDLPIQPEGTTEDIQDIDQKLIRITSPNVTATLGDFEGSLGSSELVFFPRALEGVQVEGNFKWGSFHLIPTTIPKGQSASKTIRGEEGRSQYRIDVDGEFIVVKAGSELVWLNGQRMRRGENNDYIIRDYGDPIIEFTSKHLITSNDTIRVDFEFIPEELAYQRNLQGVSGSLNLPGGRAALGFAYAVESDLNDPENAFIIIGDEELDDLRKNELDADGDGRPLIAPQRRTVWGINGRLDLAESQGLLQYAPTVEGQIAFGALDENTFSRLDAKVLSRAWKLLARSSTERLQLNLDLRALDADFVPIGASSTGRTRFNYEEQYTDEQFDDLFLLGDVGPIQTPDEKSIDLDLRVKPLSWLKLDYGLGRTEERFEGSRDEPSSETSEITLRNNFNWGFDFNPRDGLTKRPYLPRLRGDYRGSTSKVRGQDQFRKARRQANLSHRIRPFNLNVSIEQLRSTDLDADDEVNLNRKRNVSTAQVDLVDFRWASINTKYAIEEAFKKEALLTVDGKTLGFSDWQTATTAKTWTVGLFSQPRKWANFSTNISRRVFKVERELGSDSTTQLADVELRLTPFNRALDGQLTYELDKKLATERREIFTNVNPFTGREIEPGEGHYVKIDDLHYREDFENGDHIKFIQNIEDKPVSAIDVKLRLRFQPRRLLSRRRRTSRPPRGEAQKSEAGVSTHNRIAWLANALRGDIRVNITEEQEDPDPSSLYLLRNLQNKRTIFGRINQRYQLDFSPSPLLNLDFGFNTNRILNKRINNRERKRRIRDWEIGLTLNPTAKLSLGVKWEQRREEEQFAELGLEGNVAVPVSDLTQFERTNTVNFNYEVSRVLRFGIAGSYEFTSDLERLDDDPEARTRTVSLENRMTYSFIRKGRIDLNYRLGYGNSEGGIPFTRYNFYEGFSHEVRLTADYKIRKVTDLLLRFNYRLLSTEEKKPEHRMGMEVVAEL
ncbi:MAG: hypothetical protein O7E52_19875 [Candidatus Poribacteria bacterium]|nr:hypothetical protein [Candidatus Poribacteria bacterium]